MYSLNNNILLENEFSVNLEFFATNSWVGKAKGIEYNQKNKIESMKREKYELIKYILSK